MRVRSLLLVAVLLGSAACGGEAGTTSTVAPTNSSAPSTTTTVAATTTIDEVTTTVDATTTTSLPIDVFYEGRQVVGQDRFTVALGDEVSIWVLSDTDEEVHVHGYDLTFPAKAGIPLEIAFTADVPGIFEVELESTHTTLFELEVTA